MTAGHLSKQVMGRTSSRNARADGLRAGSTPASARNIPTEKENAMSKKQNRKKVIFTVTMPKTEIPFAQLSTSLKKFGKMRADFESLALRVEVIDFKK